MKKIMALVLAAMMLLACCSALAEAPEGYPEVKEGIDFGGADVTIYDYWSGEGARKEDPTEEEALQYAYHKQQTVQQAPDNTDPNPCQRRFHQQGDTHNHRRCYINLAPVKSGQRHDDFVFVHSLKAEHVAPCAREYTPTAIIFQSTQLRLQGIPQPKIQPINQLYFTIKSAFCQHLFEKCVNFLP